LIGPGGAKATVGGVREGGIDVRGIPNASFVVSFLPAGPGDYTLTVGPDIRDLFGNRMDQDGDGKIGLGVRDGLGKAKQTPAMGQAETAQDRYVSRFLLALSVEQRPRGNPRDLPLPERQSRAGDLGDPILDRQVILSSRGPLDTVVRSTPAQTAE